MFFCAMRNNGNNDKEWSSGNNGNSSENLDKS